MSEAKDNPRLAKDVLRQKEISIRHGAQVLRFLAGSLAAGVLVGVAVWFLQAPRDRDEIHFSFAGGLGLATFVVGCLLIRWLFPRPRPCCPQCGCDWLGESRNDQQTWLAWRHCPICGLAMSSDHDPPRDQG
jgi:hypothetical protein